MNQTLIDRLKVAAKRRQEYLRQMGIAGRASLLWACIGIGLIALSAIGFGFVIALNTRWPVPLLPPDIARVFSLDFGRHESILSLLWLVPVTLGFIALCAAGIRRVHSTKIPYVPPRREQLAAPPAPDVLHQGSDPPSTSPGEPQRMPQEPMQTNTEELARPTESDKPSDGGNK